MDGAPGRAEHRILPSLVRGSPHTAAARRGNLIHTKARRHDEKAPGTTLGIARPSSQLAALRPVARSWRRPVLRRRDPQAGRSIRDLTRRWVTRSAQRPKHGPRRIDQCSTSWYRISSSHVVAATCAGTFSTRPAPCNDAAPDLSPGRLRGKATHIRATVRYYGPTGGPVQRDACSPLPRFAPKRNPRCSWRPGRRRRLPSEVCSALRPRRSRPTRTGHVPRRAT